MKAIKFIKQYFKALPERGFIESGSYMFAEDFINNWFGKASVLVAGKFNSHSNYICIVVKDPENDPIKKIPDLIIRNSDNDEVFLYEIKN